MRRLFSFALLVTSLPAAALALDLTQSATAFTDFRAMTLAEKAAVSVLANADIVRGNPDGSFAPWRTLNRAEFLAIAQRSVQPVLPELAPEDLRCFPDVRADDWFATAVCWAESKRIVQGYPDGLFHPERTVNYAEAVKILVGLYEHELPNPEPNERWAWYTPYLRTATTLGLALSETPAPETFITRGQMARLAAAFLAESDGALEAYRAFEHGSSVSSGSAASADAASQESSSSSADAGSSVASSEASASSASSSSSVRQRFPAVSRQVYLGTRSLPLADGVFRSDAGGNVRLVSVRFRDELLAVSSAYLVDSAGNDVAVLQRGGADASDGKYRTWEALLPVGAYRLPAGVDTLLGVEVLTKSREAGGPANEQMEVSGITLFVQQDSDGSTKALVASSPHFPQHQTVQATITSVQNAPTAGDVHAGKNMHVASFQFGGILQNGADLGIVGLAFTVHGEGVTASNWHIATTDRPDTYICTTSGSPVTVYCDSITGGAGHIGGGIRTLQLYADIALQAGVSDPTLQVSLGDPGTIGHPGAITWTDAVGTYNWIDWPATTVIDGPVWHPR